eukprot:TRINITY_DN18581_c0_g1_i1.p1 TRINITY_DN18581_c0_g1~~TRINITY_DN18581_c0_g1_i1.p1  ORF type:complete len:560 (-),score=110.83 TRINITY_DN18581_c0_g1_i1:188-1843(-)
MAKKKKGASNITSALQLQDRLSIVAVGATGQGKSTLGNTLTATKTPVFEVSDSFDSQTRHCSHADFDVDGVQFRFVDTVGFFDTKMTPQMVYGKFAEFADRVPSGVNAFLYVEQKSRFSNEQLKRFNIFKEYVGAEALQHTILVFTHIENDQLSAQLKQDEESGRMPVALQEVLSQVKAVVGVESVDEPAKARKVILEAVQKRVEQNGGSMYSNKALQEANARRQELQLMVDGLKPGERKSAMEHAMRGLYDGSRTRDEVRGTIMHAQVMEEKEKVEDQVRQLETEKADIESQRLKLEFEVQRQKDEVYRLGDELRRVRQDHQRQDEERAKLEEERRERAEKDKQRREREHATELARHKAEYQTQCVKLEAELQRHADDAKRVKGELEQAQQAHSKREEERERSEQERIRQEEQDKRRRDVEHSRELESQKQRLESKRLALELDLRRVEDESRQLKQSLEQERNDRQKADKCHQEEKHRLTREHERRESMHVEKHAHATTESEEQYKVYTSQQRIIAQQRDRMESLELGQKVMGAGLVASALALMYKSTNR